MKRVLFVCMGNICRSPLAEGIAREHARRAGVAIEFDSAGTEDYHVGAAPDPRACALARERGASIDALRARQVTREDFARFDLILAADRRNLEALRRLRPAQGGAELALLLDWAGGTHGREVPDPYYGDARDFVQVYDLLHDAMPALLDRVGRA
jgi:protein-tyrosine phosphatase